MAPSICSCKQLPERESWPSEIPHREGVEPWGSRRCDAQQAAPALSTYTFSLPPSLSYNHDNHDNNDNIHFCRPILASSPTTRSCSHRLRIIETYNSHQLLNYSPNRPCDLVYLTRVLHHSHSHLDLLIPRHFLLYTRSSNFESKCHFLPFPPPA